MKIAAPLAAATLAAALLAACGQTGPLTLPSSPPVAAPAIDAAPASSSAEPVKKPSPTP